MDAEVLTQIDLVDDPGYRRNGIYSLINAKGEVLITQSPREQGDKMWSTPGGGLEPGQTPTQNMLAELNEELGITPDQLSNIQTKVAPPFAHEYDPERSVREAGRGRPSKGKSYFPSAANYTGPSELHPNPDEIAAYKWVSPDEAKRILLQTNPKKGADLVKAIDASLSKLGHNIQR